MHIVVIVLALLVLLFLGFAILGISMKNAAVMDWLYSSSRFLRLKYFVNYSRKEQMCIR